jgi:hypothetical protein
MNTAAAMSSVDKEVILPTPAVYKKAKNNFVTLVPCTAEDLAPFLEIEVCEMVEPTFIRNKFLTSYCKEV